MKRTTAAVLGILGLFLLACGGSTVPQKTGPSPLETQVIAQLAKQHGSAFEVKWENSGVNAGNLFDGPKRTAEATIWPVGKPELSSPAWVVYDKGQLISMEDGYTKTLAERAIVASVLPAMKEQLPAIQGLTVDVGYTRGSQPNPTSPKTNLERVNMRVWVEGLDEAAILDEHGAVLKAAQAIGPLGTKATQIEMIFFAGKVPPPLDTEPWTRKNISGLTLRSPVLFFVASPTTLQSIESFAKHTNAIGFGRRGTLAEVLAR